MKVGRLAVVPLMDGTARVPIEEAVEHPEGKRWDCAQHPFDKTGRIRMDIGSFMVKIGDRTILVDLGGGVFSEGGTTTGQLLEDLRATGTTIDDVTDVFFTHLHWDHVGWSTVDGAVTFPNATYRVHVDDWTHFMTGPSAVGTIRDLLLPIESRLEPFDSEFELLPGFAARPAPGHTPGSTIYIVSDGGERALLLGDTVHTVGQLTNLQTSFVSFVCL